MKSFDLWKKESAKRRFFFVVLYGAILKTIKMKLKKTKKRTTKTKKKAKKKRRGAFRPHTKKLPKIIIVSS